MGRAEDAIRERQRQRAREAGAAMGDPERDMRDAYRRLLALVDEWTPRALASLDGNGWQGGELVAVEVRCVRTGLFRWVDEPIEEAAVSVGGIAAQGREIAAWGSSYLFADGTWKGTSPHSTRLRGTFHETVVAELAESRSLNAKACTDARLSGVPESLRRYATGRSESFELPAIELPFGPEALRRWGFI